MHSPELSTERGRRLRFVASNVASFFGLALLLSFAQPALAHVHSGGMERSCRGHAPLEVLFRFGTGARVAAPPAVSADGSIYVGTSDGYVHALDGDGAYRWSYTLAGPIVGRAALSESGLLLVPTLRRIYAIRPDGTLHWVFASPVPVLSDLVRDGMNRYHFTSDGGRLFALSSRGALVAHVPGTSGFSTGPVALFDGAIAVGRADGRVLVTRAGKNRHFALEESISAVLPCASAEGVCAVAGGVLRPLGCAPCNFRARASRAGSNAEFLAILSGDTSLELFRGTGGRPLFSIVLPQSGSSSPVIDQDGTLFLGLRNGTLLGVSMKGTISGCSSLGHSPIHTPVLDPARRRVLVTLEEGLLVAVGAR